MDWLKDKKNAPIVAAIAIGVIVVVAACLWLFVFRAAPAPAAPDQTAQQMPDGSTPMPGAQAPGTDPGAVPAPGGAPASGAPAATASAGTKVASVAPMETWRGDPFQPIGYKPQPRVTIKPHIRDFPFERLPVSIEWVNRGNGRGKQKPEIQQPSRRMAGILLNDRVYAIIESEGVSQVVQPGDYTTDRLATVVRIESDKVVLKTVDEKPRYITVKMAGSPSVQSGGSNAMPTGGNSYMPPPPMMPPPGMRNPGRRGLAAP